MGWLLLLVACYQAAAQDVVPKRPVEIEALADRARALPPEFSADLHLKLAVSPLIADVKWKRELIEEAFVNGARAPLPYRQRGDAFADSRPSREVESHDLEALTLQTRAVDAMLAFDPPRALELYQRITPPALPSVPCTGIVTPNVAAWYETAAKVFDRGFTAKQREKGDDMHLLRQRIGSMHSPSQVVPALRMIFAAALSDEQRKDLVTTFAATLDRLSGTDREYGPSENLLVPAALPQWHDTPLFVPVMRAYIVRQVSGPRCRDRLDSKELPASVRQFNTLVSRLDPARDQYRPITAEEVKPLRDDGTYTPHVFWRSTRAKEVLSGLKSLNFGDAPEKQTAPLTPEMSQRADRAQLALSRVVARETSIERYTAVLELLDSWKESDEESPDDYLWMVGDAWHSLVLRAPNAAARENAMGRYLTYLETHYTATRSRNLWFGLVRDMLSTAKSQRPGPATGTWILDRLARSANPIIALYADVDRRLAGR